MRRALKTGKDGDGPTGEDGADDNRTTERWLISNDMCGSLLGKKGSAIQAINRDSGAWVKIAHPQEMPRGSQERQVDDAIKDVH